MRNHHTHGNGNENFNSSNTWHWGLFLLVACFHWEKDCRQKTTHLFQFHQLFRNPLTKAFLKDEEFVQKKLGPGEIVPPSLDVTPLILADDNKRRKNLADDTPLWIDTTKKHYLAILCWTYHVYCRAKLLTNEHLLLLLWLFFRVIKVLWAASNSSRSSSILL